MALVFDITGEYAMFRKFYTTTSSASYPFPPPTAVGGLIAAISGVENKSENKAHLASYWEALYGNRIAISILSPIKWFTTSINLWNYKYFGFRKSQKKEGIHNIIKHQFVKRPKYRIYVEGPIEERLKPFLEEGSFVFTPYLGTAYSFANIHYIGSFNPVKLQDGETRIKSIIPVDLKPKINLKKTHGIFKDIVPLQMDTERGLTKSLSVFYPADVKAGIFVDNPEEIGGVLVGNDEIVWLPEWSRKPSG